MSSLPQALVQFRTDLEDAIGREVARRRDSRRHRFVALALAVLAGATGVALFVSTPWKSSPGFLERAQAALTPPAGSVLHQRWETTRTSADFGCEVTTGPDEMWVDQSPPHRWRADLSNPFEDEAAGSHLRTLACAEWGTTELGGSDGETVSVSPRNILPTTDANYVPTLREAIENGSAHDEGKTELDGRTVERIRFDPTCGPLPPDPCPSQPIYAYVDPETFFPVQIEVPGGLTLVLPDGRVLRFHIVQRFLTFEYLPRTEDNLALADIDARHTNANRP